MQHVTPATLFADDDFAAPTTPSPDAPADGWPCATCGAPGVGHPADAPDAVQCAGCVAGAMDFALSQMGF